MEGVTQLMVDIGSYPMLKECEQRELIVKAQAGCTVSRNRVVEANMRLVVRFTRGKTGWNVMLDDLIVEGSIGLLEAVMKFDVDRKIKFSTYAAWWIKRSIRDHIKSRYMIRIPGYAHSEYWKRHNGDLTYKTPLQEKCMAKAAVVLDDGVMLNKPVGCQITLLDGVADHRKVADPIHDQEVKEEATARLLKVNEFMAHLPAKEKLVMQLRFGLDEQPPKTLSQVGEVIGLTKERVRQIQQTATRRIKRYVERGLPVGAADAW